MSEPDASRPRMGLRRWLTLGMVGVVLAAAAVGLALFQPWKVWIDDEVDEAAPVGAVPITARTETVEPAAPSTPAATSTIAPSTVATSTVAPSTLAPSTVAPPETSAVAATTVPVPPPAATGAPVVLGGEFISIDHGTSGTVVLLQDATGAQFARLENLDTSNGPDLFVYLSANPPDGPEGQFDDDYVNLGRLEGNVGSSNYAIPAGTDLSRYASIVIWCDRFDSAFGAAPLS